MFAGENLSIFLGQGPSRLANGAPNPLATGVLLSNGRIGLIQIGSTYALVATGTVSLVGISGVTIGGTVTVRVNTTGKAIDETPRDPGQHGRPRRGHVRDRGDRQALRGARRADQRARR